jgi:thioredoxin-related protein
MSMTALRKFFTSPWFWLFWLSLLAASAHAAPADAFFETSLGDFAAESKAAQQQGKAGILLMVEAEGCPYCRRMREQVLSQPAVQQYFKAHFLSFSIDMLGSVTVTDFAGKDVTEKDFARTLKIRGTPTFLFFSADGKEMARYTGATKGVDEFMALGHFVADGHWQKMTFDQFRSKP